MSTLDRAAEQLARALAVLDDQIAESAGRLLTRLGWELPAGVADIGLSAIDLSALAGSLQILETVKVSGTDVQVSAAYADVVRSLADALAQLRRVAAGFTAPADYLATTNIVNEFFPRLLDFVTMQAVAYLAPPAFAVGQFCGIFLGEPHDENPAAFQSQHVRYVVRWDRIGALLSDPAALFREVYGWGTPQFDASALVANLGWILQFAGASTLMRQLPQRAEGMISGHALPDGTDPSLQLFVSLVKGLGLDTLDVGVSLYGLHPTTAGGADGGFGMSPYANGTTEVSFPLSDRVSLTVTSSVDVRSGLALVMRPGQAAALRTGLNSRPVTGDGNVVLSLRYEAAAGKPVTLLNLPGILQLDVKALSAGGGLQSGRPAVELALEGGHLVLDASGGDGFLTTVLGGARIDAAFDLAATFSAAGLQLGGSGGLQLELPVHLELGPVDIQKLYVALGFSGGKIPLELSAGFAVSLGPIQASVDRMGVLAALSFPAGGGNVGPAQLDFAFKPPTGVGLSVDAGLISGGGFLSADPDRGEYAGALSLEFAGFVELTAIGLISTRMPDGSKGFSLLIVITTEFGGGGIQLGYGFTLLAVGGIIGLNRGMNLDELVKGVRAGSIDSVMFPTDVIANAPRIISDLRRFFPPEQGRFLIGPMAKIGWGTPTLVSVSLGVVIEIPPGTVAILGVLTCVLPAAELPLLVLQVDFAGAFEPDKKRLWFFAQLFDSHVLSMTIDGGMGLYVSWGDNPDFVLTVGGFHPSYKPPQLPFPVPDRLSVDILNQPGELIRVSGYFAVTSNTVQFGAQAQLELGFGGFGVSGHLAFDALFQFSPFRFVIGISASVSLKAFGVGVFGIDLQFQLEGPAPWRAHGRGSISLLFFEISADFDIQWGEDRNTTLPGVAAMALLANEIGKTEGWATRLPTGGGKPLVTLRTLPPADELVLHPLGTLFIRQRALPLDVRIDRVGQRRPSDGKRFTVAPDSAGGLRQVSTLGDKFAMAQYQDMDDAAKLARTAYEDQDAGLELTAAKGVLASARAVRRSARYEQIVIDTGPAARPAAAALAQRIGATRIAVAADPRPSGSARKQLVDVAPAVFTRLLAGSSTSRSPISRLNAQRRQPFAAADTVQVTGQRYVVAYVRNNAQAFPPNASANRQGAASYRSRSTAADALDEWVATDPALAGKLHVIPSVEMTGRQVVPGTWTATANALPTAARGGGAILLRTGRVLIVGGADESGTAVAAAAVLDPVADSWSSTASMSTPRRAHTTTLLGDGRVLAIGGLDARDRVLASAEVYDPILAAWSPVPAMGAARHGHSATVLEDGRVLVAGGTGTRGGRDGAALSSVEILDPTAGGGSWSPVEGGMTEARTGHQAVRLDADGSVLFIGGETTTGGEPAALATTERYDAAHKRWMPTPELSTPRRGHRATLLADGSVLVSGGDPAAPADVNVPFRAEALATAERYVVNAATWTAAPGLPSGRTGHQALRLRTGAVLVIGGASGPASAAGYRSVLSYAPDAGAWTTLGALATGRWDAAAVELADGRVLVAGGRVLGAQAGPGDGTDVLTGTAELLTL